jgi:hypothetical protein
MRAISVAPIDNQQALELIKVLAVFLFVVFTDPVLGMNAKFCIFTALTKAQTLE